MTVVDLRKRPAPSPAPVRDVLASDIDDRLVVWEPPRPRVQHRDRQIWPVPRRGRRLPAGWPIGVAVAGWPVWWALGLTNLVFPVCAAPLAWQLLRRGKVRVPSGFWMWALFLVLVLISGFAINADLAGTSTSQGIGRYFAFGFRLLNYLAVTVMMLYVGNTDESELPRRRVISWLGVLALACIGLASLSLLLPTFGYVAPSSYVLPGWTQAEGSAVVNLSQMQPVLGDVTPRPSAPFAFTNAWGNVLSLLLVWLVVGWGVLGSRARRLGLYAVLAFALVPIVYSLNRGMWIGLGLALMIVAVRLAIRGHVRALAGLVLAVTVAAVSFAGSPLESMVQARLDAGHSNSVRGSLFGSAVDAAKQSPVIGFGSTRQTLGSEASIAIGPSQACPRCGSRNIGSTGQLTLVLISQGFLGAALYFGFLVWSALRYLRDHSVLGIAGTLVVTLEIFYAAFYSALTMPLAIALLSIGLLWRNEQIRRAAVSA